MRWALLIGFAVAAAGCGDDGAYVPRDAGARFDAPIQGDGAPGVACLGQNCDPDQACCRDRVYPPLPSYFCVPSADLCEEVAARCDGPEDCDGGICCGDADGSYCLATPEDCQAVPGNVICQTEHDCPGSCCETRSGLWRVCCFP